jgi:hypothetical protein
LIAVVTRGDPHGLRAPVVGERWVTPVARDTTGAHARLLRTRRLPRPGPRWPTRGQRARRSAPIAQPLLRGRGARGRILRGGAGGCPRPGTTQGAARGGYEREGHAPTDGQHPPFPFAFHTPTPWRKVVPGPGSARPPWSAPEGIDRATRCPAAPMAMVVRCPGAPLPGPFPSQGGGPSPLCPRGCPYTVTPRPRTKWTISEMIATTSRR